MVGTTTQTIGTALRQVTRRGLVALFVLACVVAAGVIGASELRNRYRADLARSAVETLNQQTAALAAWVDQYRPIAPILARDPRIRTLAENPSRVVGEAASRELEAINSLAGTDVTYVLGADGTTLASSNWDQPDSFVGRRFDYRP